MPSTQNYFILVKETEDKKAMSPSLFLHGPLTYMPWDGSYALFSLKVIARDPDYTCWFEPALCW